jgi:hypothetical protein
MLSVPNNWGADYADAFCETLRSLLPQRRKDVVEPKSPPPIARLGAMQIPFGQHAGKCFDDIPLDYLDWLCRSQEDFYRDLRAYLKHPELESRRGALERVWLRHECS